MKKFWEKYRVLIFIIVGVAAFVGLSLLVENVGKEEEIIPDDVIAWQSEVPEQEYAITVIALSTCEHCANYKPVITAIATEHSIPLYWFEVDLYGDEASELIKTTFDFSEYTVYSPYTAITNYGEVVAQTTGGMEEADAITFLKDAGAIK